MNLKIKNWWFHLEAATIWKYKPFLTSGMYLKQFVIFPLFIFLRFRLCLWYLELECLIQLPDWEERKPPDWFLLVIPNSSLRVLQILSSNAVRILYSKERLIVLYSYKEYTFSINVKASFVCNCAFPRIKILNY